MITLKTIKNNFKKEFSAYRVVQTSATKQNLLKSKIAQLEAELIEANKALKTALENSNNLNNIYLDAIRVTKLSLSGYANQEIPESDTSEKHQFSYDIEVEIRNSLNGVK